MCRRERALLATFLSSSLALLQHPIVIAAAALEYIIVEGSWHSTLLILPLFLFLEQLRLWSTSSWREPSTRCATEQPTRPSWRCGLEAVQKAALAAVAVLWSCEQCCAKLLASYLW